MLLGTGEDARCVVREECAAIPGIILKSEQCADVGGRGLQWVAVTIATPPFSITPPLSILKKKHNLENIQILQIVGCDDV